MYAKCIDGEKEFCKLGRKFYHLHYFEHNEEKRQFDLSVSAILEGLEYLLGGYFYKVDEWYARTVVLRVTWHRMAKQYKTEKNKIQKLATKYVLRLIYIKLKEIGIDISIPYDRTKD